MDEMAYAGRELEFAMDAGACSLARRRAARAGAGQVNQRCEHAGRERSGCAFRDARCPDLAHAFQVIDVNLACPVKKI